MEKLTHKSVIAEGNELIAIFMECKRVPTSPEIPKYYVESFYYEREVETSIGMLKDCGCEYTPEDMLYHSDWSWLMPVVERIESTVVESKEDVHLNDDLRDIELHFTVEISDTQCMIHSDMLPQYYGTDKDFLKLYSCLNDSKIVSTWKAIITFIEWFNTQNQKEKC